MNLILLFPSDFKSNLSVVRLSGRRHSHIVNILKTQLNESLTVGLINDQIGTGTVTKITPDFCELKVSLSQAPPRPSKITLILALPRPLVLNRILSSITTLGVKDIFLIQSERVEKSYWKSPVLDENNIQQQLHLGLEQCVDTILPTVTVFKNFKHFLQNNIKDISNNKTKLIAHPSGKDIHKNPVKPVVLIIGPEGGFIPAEIDKFLEYGFKPIKFGNRILRVETAIPYIISNLEF